jgi:murein DD-endopeptidase MepM/ murein hydrolase activator NlpD
VQGHEPKTPLEGAPQSEGGTRAVETDAVENASPENDTSDAASMARSASDASSAALEKAAVAGRRASGGTRFGFGVRVAMAIAGGAAALIGVVLGPAVAFGPKGASTSPGQQVTAPSVAASLAAGELVVDGGGPLDGALSSQDDAGRPARVPVWRVAELAADGAVSLTQEPLGHRSLLVALAAARVTPMDAQRVTRSLSEFRSVDRLTPKEELTIAFDKGSGRVVAYELASSPSEVWQGREASRDDGTRRFDVRKLDLQTSRVRVGRAVLVGADLRASFADAGLTPVDDVLAMLDDALDGHTEVSDIRPGARLRLLGTQEQVEGAFVRWVSLEAIEYFPATNAPPVRVYAFGDGDGPPDSAKRRGWYDAKGRQPFHGGFRSPVPLARVASRFNPHRMHPILHVVMPHNGVDFAAPVGTPVYATAAGVVTSVGNAGPCGNRVELAHTGGIVSVYCHLSRFAAGLRLGQHIEQRQLVGYVGQTGRVTGPHLHFGIKRNGVFVDPMTLRLDGVRVVPRAVRDDFDRVRGELDALLDGIPLPASAGAPVEVVEPDAFYEEP